MQCQVMSVQRTVLQQHSTDGDSGPQEQSLQALLLAPRCLQGRETSLRGFRAPRLPRLPRLPPLPLPCRAGFDRGASFPPVLLAFEALGTGSCRLFFLETQTSAGVTLGPVQKLMDRGIHLGRLLGHISLAHRRKLGWAPHAEDLRLSSLCLGSLIPCVKPFAGWVMAGG